MSISYTTQPVAKQGGTWQVLRWDEEHQEWTQVGPYWDSENEAMDAIKKLEEEGRLCPSPTPTLETNAASVLRLIYLNSDLARKNANQKAMIERLTVLNAELLAALNMAEHKLTAYVGVCKDDKELMNIVLPMSRAAIAKAEGKQ
jgi:hypothetical protein